MGQKREMSAQLTSTPRVRALTRGDDKCANLDTRAAKTNRCA